MLPPHELKNKTFSRVLRGYNSVEVDEHINFIIEQYTELYRQNDELERRLKLAEAQLAEFRADEESIRSALVNAQKASAKIISEANERADMILRSAKSNCNKIIASFKRELQKQRQELLALRRAVAEFKTRLFEQYQQHITYIEQISPDGQGLDLDTPDDVYVRRVVEQVKADIAAGNIPVETSGIGANNVQEEESIITLGASSYKDEPAIREILRPQPKSEQSEEKQSMDTGEPARADEEEAFADSLAEMPDGEGEGGGEEDGGGYLDEALDEAIDIPETPDLGDKADEDEPQETDMTDSRHGDTLPIDTIKPGDRPSTIAAAAEASRSVQKGCAQGSYRSASVKETIRELNKRFVSGEPAEAEASQDAKPADEFAPDAEDEELLSLIRSVSSAAEEKNKEYKSKKKNKKKPLTLTEEFDLISEDESQTGSN